MTLNITIVAPWSIWQCSDHRLTDPRSGDLVEDKSIKHVAFRFPDGGALLAYAGLGSDGGVHISDWVREVLRRETCSFDDILVYLREQATNVIGRICLDNKIPHMFSKLPLSGVAVVMLCRDWLAGKRGASVIATLLPPLIAHS